MNDNMLKLMRALNGIDNKYIVDAAAPLLRGDETPAPAVPVNDAPALSAVTAAMEAAPDEQPPEQTADTPAPEADKPDDTAQAAAPVVPPVKILPPPTEKSLQKPEKKQPGSARVLGKRMLALIIAAATLLTLLAATGITAAALDAGSPLEKTASALMPEAGIVFDVLSGGGSVTLEATVGSDLTGTSLTNGPLDVKVKADRDKKGSLLFGLNLENDAASLSAGLTLVGDTVQITSEDVLDKTVLNVNLSTLLEDLEKSLFAPGSGSKLAMTREDYAALTDFVRTLTDNLGIGGKDGKGTDESGEALNEALAAIAADMKDAMRPRKSIKTVTVRGTRVTTSAAVYTVDEKTVNALCASVREHLIHNKTLLKAQFDDESILTLLKAARTLVNELESALNGGSIDGSLTVCTKGGCLILCELDIACRDGESEKTADNAFAVKGRLETTANPAKDRRLDMSLSVNETADGKDMEVLSLSAAFKGTETRQTASLTLTSQATDGTQTVSQTIDFGMDMKISADGRYALTLDGKQNLSMDGESDMQPLFSLTAGGKWSVSRKGFSMSLDKLAVSSPDAYGVSSDPVDVLTDSSFAVTFSAKAPDTIRLSRRAESLFDLSEDELVRLDDKLNAVMEKLVSGSEETTATDDPDLEIHSEPAETEPVTYPDGIVVVENVLGGEFAEERREVIEPPVEAEITLEYIFGEPVFDAMPLRRMDDVPEPPADCVQFLRYDDKTNTVIVSSGGSTEDGSPVTVIVFYDADTLAQQGDPAVLNGTICAMDAADGYLVCAVVSGDDLPVRIIGMTVDTRETLMNSEYSFQSVCVGTRYIPYFRTQNGHVQFAQSGEPIQDIDLHKPGFFSIVGSLPACDTPLIAYAGGAGAPGSGNIFGSYIKDGYTVLSLLDTRDTGNAVMRYYAADGITTEVPYYDGFGFWHSACGYADAESGELLVSPIPNLRKKMNPVNIPVYTYTNDGSGQLLGVCIDCFYHGPRKENSPSLLGHGLNGQTTFYAGDGTLMGVLDTSVLTKAAAWDGKGRVFLVNYDSMTRKATLTAYNLSAMYQDIVNPSIDPVETTDSLQPDCEKELDFDRVPVFDRMPQADSEENTDFIRYDESLNLVYVCRNEVGSVEDAWYEISVYDGTNLSLRDKITGDGIIVSMDADGGYLAYSRAGLGVENLLIVQDMTGTDPYRLRQWEFGELFGTDASAAGPGIMDVTLNNGILTTTNRGTFMRSRRIDLTDRTAEHPAPTSITSGQVTLKAAVSAYDPIHDCFLYIDSTASPVMQVVDRTGKRIGSTRALDKKTTEIPYFDGATFWHSETGYIGYMSKNVVEFLPANTGLGFIPLYNGRGAGAPYAFIGLISVEEPTPGSPYVGYVGGRRTQTVFYTVDGTMLDALPAGTDAVGMAWSSTGIVYMVVYDRNAGTSSLRRYDMTVTTPTVTDGDVSKYPEVVPSTGDGVLSAPVPPKSGNVFNPMNGLNTQLYEQSNYLRYDPSSNRVFITAASDNDNATRIFAYNADTLALSDVLTLNKRITAFDAYDGYVVYAVSDSYSKDKYTVTVADAYTLKPIFTMNAEALTKTASAPTDLYLSSGYMAVEYMSDPIQLVDLLTGEVTICYGLSGHRVVGAVDRAAGVLMLAETGVSRTQLYALDMKSGAYVKGDKLDGYQYACPYRNGDCFLYLGNAYGPDAVALEQPIAYPEGDGYVCLASAEHGRLGTRDGKTVLTDLEGTVLKELTGEVAGVSFAERDGESRIFVITKNAGATSYRLNAFRLGA